MTRTDDIVMEWLYETDDVPAATPKTIHISLKETRDSTPAYSTITTRVRKLDRADLLEKHPEAESHYRLAPKGERYLLGDLGPEALPDPDADDDEDDDSEGDSEE